MVVEEVVLVQWAAAWMALVSLEVCSEEGAMAVELSTRNKKKIYIPQFQTMLHKHLLTHNKQATIRVVL